MPRSRSELQLTIVYEPAENGWLTATVPALPGTISTGPNKADARENVLDALRLMLATPPKAAVARGEVEQLRVRLEVPRDLGLEL